MTAAIYIIRNIVDGKAYIGSSADVGRRLRKHRLDLAAQRHHSSKLQNAWNKYGADLFTFDIVEIIFDLSSMHEREQAYMDMVGPFYNVAPASVSVLGIKRSDETRRKISNALIGNKNNLGKKRSAETREKMSASMQGKKNALGKKLPLSFSEKLSIRNVGNTYGRANKGRPFSDSHIAAISAGQIRRRQREREEEEATC